MYKNIESFWDLDAALFTFVSFYIIERYIKCYFNNQYSCLTKNEIMDPLNIWNCVQLEIIETKQFRNIFRATIQKLIKSKQLLEPDHNKCLITLSVMQMRKVFGSVYTKNYLKNLS
ncbi:unnamed protein product [Paramecium primaurelia]|uniref:Uncharacterized protein n=1 Tax=Paramecium primaurelia TaxID=5886 RepID=A0A8S1KI09_PARPR|nr:unnamed protein product [Paramecium primaurelia]